MFEIDIAGLIRSTLSKENRGILQIDHLVKLDLIEKGCLVSESIPNCFGIKISFSYESKNIKRDKI